MPNYYVNEAVFALPERGFVDRTVHRLESPLTGAEPLGLAIRRVPLQEGKSLRQLVDEEVAANEGKLPGFTVLEDVELVVGGAPMLVLRARWRTEDAAQYLLQAHAALEGGQFVLVVTGPFAERAACDETFDRMVRNLTWRSG